MRPLLALLLVLALPAPALALAQEPGEQGARGQATGPAPIVELPELPAWPTAPPAPVEVPDLLAALRGEDRSAGFAALRRLALCDFRQDVAAALRAVAADPRADETWRDNAAMGLGNMQRTTPAAELDALRSTLRAVLERDRADTPDGILRLALRLDDAAFVRGALGDGLRDSPVEIDVLAQLPDAASRARLLEILDASPGRKAQRWSRRAAVAGALLEHGDPLGLDVLVGLLPRDQAPGLDHRRNAYRHAARWTAAGFAVLPTETDEDLDAATAALAAWWQAHREGFRLPAPPLQRVALVEPTELEVLVRDWRARADAPQGEVVVSRGTWLEAAVLRRLLPGRTFCALTWEPVDDADAPGERPARRRTTLVLAERRITHVLTGSVPAEDLAGLLRDAGVAVLDPDEARSVWEACWALCDPGWPHVVGEPLRRVERTAAGSWALWLSREGEPPRRVELEVDARGVVRAARLHDGTSR